MNKSNTQTDNEIKLEDIIKLFRRKKKFILISALLFFVFGVFIALTSEKIYTAQTKFILNKSDPIHQSVFNFFPTLGNYGKNTETIIYPDLYMDVIKSIPFKRNLLDSMVIVDNFSQSLTYYDYFNKYYKPSFLSVVKKYIFSLPNIILSIPSRILSSSTKKANVCKKDDYTNSIFSISPEENKLFGLINNSISVNYEKSTNSILLKVDYINPFISAQLAQTTFSILENKIITYQTKKESEKVKFIEKIQGEYKQKFEKIQLKLARHTDYNQNVSSAIANTKREKLETEYEHLKYIYNDITKQLEQARIKLKEESNVFSIIEPVSIPLSNSKPNRKSIILISTLFGFILSITYIFFKEFIFYSFWSNFESTEHASPINHVLESKK